MYFKNLFGRLQKTRNPDLTQKEVEDINNVVDYCINNADIPPNKQKDIFYILKICNAIYNNAPNILSPVSDEKYDKLIVLCNKLNLEYPIGSEKIDFKMENDLELSKGHTKYIGGKLEIVQQIPDVKNYTFFSQLAKNTTPPRKEDFIINHDNILVEKRERNVVSDYGLCGTLDKCKYVTVKDAMENTEDNSGVISIFQRDFLDKHINKNIVNPNDIELILSLKYDGFSVENVIEGDTIVQSCTRGNVNTGEAVDMTPIFGGMKFARAYGLSKDKFAIKFEYIITNQNMELIKRTFGKEYVNNRNAVSGLIGGLDARLYRDYLTPIPLETSLDMDRLDEINFLNLHYTKGIDFKHIYIRGDYNQILNLIQQFVKEVDSLRNYMPFMIDGIVVEYRDKNIRNILGIKNNVPQYAVAIKFNPMKKISTFNYYNFTVGADGRITPMAYFEPVDFLGATHSFTTIHSYERFKQLNLKPGDKVILSLVNDVILYLTKAGDEFQDVNNNNLVIEFPKKCPSCGCDLIFSNTNKLAYCPNMNCNERVINRLGNMIRKLGLKDFSTETIRTLGVKSFKDLYLFDDESLKNILGPVRSVQLKQALNEIIFSGDLYDYQILGSIGFTSIGEKTWKLILEKYKIDDILNGADISSMVSIKGIGESIYTTIMNELHYFIDDLNFIFKTFKYRISTGLKENKEEVVFTGIRNKELEKLAEKCGYYINENLTNKTRILVVPYDGFTASSKIEKVFKRYSREYSDFINKKIEINWDNIKLVQICNARPEIMNIHHFNQYLERIPPTSK